MVKTNHLGRQSTLPPLPLLLPPFPLPTPIHPNSTNKYRPKTQLFLRFEGPTTILLQSRASSLRDVLTSGDVDEIAQAEPGSVQAALRRAESKAEDDDTGIDGKAQARRPSEEGVQHPRLRVASVKPGGAVKFEKREDLSEFVPGKT